MGFDLRSVTGREERFTGTWWSVVLNVIQNYGWAPAGTEPPEALPVDQKWEGRYDYNDGQLVSSSDAFNIAAACRSAAAAANLQEVVLKVASQMEASYLRLSGRSLSLAHIKAEDLRPVLAEFADFCEEGAFHIW